MIIYPTELTHHLLIALVKQYTNKPVNQPVQLCPYKSNFLDDLGKSYNKKLDRIEGNFKSFPLGNNDSLELIHYQAEYKRNISKKGYHSKDDFGVTLFSLKTNPNPAVFGKLNIGKANIYRESLIGSIDNFTGIRFGGGAKAYLIEGDITGKLKTKKINLPGKWNIEIDREGGFGAGIGVGAEAGVEIGKTHDDNRFNIGGYAGGKVIKGFNVKFNISFGND